MAARWSHRSLLLIAAMLVLVACAGSGATASVSGDGTICLHTKDAIWHSTGTVVPVPAPLLTPTVPGRLEGIDGADATFVADDGRSVPVHATFLDPDRRYEVACAIR